MKRHKIIATTLALFGAAAMSANAIVNLQELAFNIDGAVSSGLNDPLPSGVSLAGFDTGTGLGTISYTTPGLAAAISRCLSITTSTTPSTPFLTKSGLSVASQHKGVSS